MRGGVASPSTEAVPQLALGHAHRRARVFWFWWMGMVFAVPGAVQAIVLAGTGQNPGNGLVLLVLVSLLMVATPPGTAPDVLPILAFLAAFPVTTGTGMLYSRHLHQHRDRLYAAWLRRR